jgi:type I restriction enzyme S subunit
MELRSGYKETDVGVIPEDWDARPIGPEIDLLTGFPFPSNGYVKSGVRLLRGSNVKRGVIDWDDELTEYWSGITPDITQFELQEGDLIIAMDGSLVGRSYGRLTARDLPALLLQRVARIRSKRLDVGYLTAFIGSERFVKYSDAVKTVTAVPHISPADIRNFRIPIPPTISEQRAIAASLSNVDAFDRFA